MMQIDHAHSRARAAPITGARPHSVDDSDAILVHDAWAAPPLAPGVWDLDPSTSTWTPKQPISDYNDCIPMATPAVNSSDYGLPLNGLGFFALQHKHATKSATANIADPFTLSPESAPRSPVLPPAPRPAGLSLAPFSPEEERRGRSPPLHVRAPCPPAPRLGCNELAAFPQPPIVPPVEGTRPTVQRGFSALGLKFNPKSVTPPSPPLSDSAVRRCRPRSPTMDAGNPYPAPIRRALERRGNSDNADVAKRVDRWRGTVAAATYSGSSTPVATAKEDLWADELSLRLGRLGHDSPKSTSHALPHIRPRPQHTNSYHGQPAGRHSRNISMQSGYSTPGGELDSWAQRIGRSRGRRLDMPVQRTTSTRAP